MYLSKATRSQLSLRTTFFGASIDVSDHRQLKTNILPGKLSVFEEFNCRGSWVQVVGVGVSNITN